MNLLGLKVFGKVNEPQSPTRPTRPDKERSVKCSPSNRTHMSTQCPLYKGSTTITVSIPNQVLNPGIRQFERTDSLD